jgi:hypothetical protein
MVFEQKIACIRRDGFAHDGTAHFSTVELRTPAGTNSEAPDCSLAPEFASVNPFIDAFKSPSGIDALLRSGRLFGQSTTYCD